MGQLGKYIDRMCRDHPDVMIKVLDMEFGSFATWEDHKGNACLVGSIRRARGFGAIPHAVGQDCAEESAMGGLASRVALRRGVIAWSATIERTVDSHQRYAPWLSRKDLRLAVIMMSGQLTIVGTKLLSSVIKARIARRLSPPVAPPSDFRLEFPPRTTRREILTRFGFLSPFAWHPSMYEASG